MNRPLVTLVRREFWENRALWIAPLLAAVAVLAAMAFGNLNARSNPLASLNSVLAMRGIVMASTTFLAVVTVLAAGLYLSDCLYGERKDRSILFWKSLPVSDTATVVSKLLVAMVVLPAGVLLVSMVTELLGTGIFLLRVDGQASGAELLAAWPMELARVAVVMLFCILWYMPIATYLMIASVLARRVPVGYAILPLAGAATLEPLMFGSSYVATFLRERLAPWVGRRLVDLNADTWRVFADLDLWLGLAAAAGMLYIVIRLRRYRDDT